MLFPEEEKIIVEEIRSNGQTVVEERSSYAFYLHTSIKINNKTKSDIGVALLPPAGVWWTLCTA